MSRPFEAADITCDLSPFVSVELCATSDGRVVWTETYEAPLANTFDVLGPIGAKIIGSLNAEIETAERSRAMRYRDQ
jgi:hypothetical protein